VRLHSPLVQAEYLRQRRSLEGLHRAVVSARTHEWNENVLTYQPPSRSGPSWRGLLTHVPDTVRHATAGA